MLNTETKFTYISFFILLNYLNLRIEGKICKTLIHLQLVFLLNHGVSILCYVNALVIYDLPPQVVLFMKTALLSIKNWLHTKLYKVKLTKNIQKYKSIFCFVTWDSVCIKVNLKCLKILQDCLLWLIASMFFGEICLMFCFAWYLVKFWHHISIFPLYFEAVYIF